MLRNLPRQPRSKPRLKLFRITCAWCGKQANRWYPSRPSVRERMGPRYRFCSTAHANRHGAWRRRKEDAQPRPCARRGCGHVIEPTGAPGRPRLYHDDACKEQARSERARPVSDALRAAQARRERAAALVERDAVREALDGAELAQAAQATWRADQAAWQASEPPEPPSEWTFGRVDVPLLESPTAREARLIEEREARNTREAMVHALAAWRKGKPKRPAREQHAPVAVLREQLAPFEAATAAAELAAEQAVVEVELARDRLAKRAADARRRRASKAAPTWTRPVPQMDGYDEWARQQANGAA